VVVSIVVGVDVVVFFFQAEDGIRDWSVTGVQTCALPICWQGSFRALLEQDQGGELRKGNPGLVADSGPPPAWPGFRKLRVSAVRSEERRVGKEGRSRWSW